MTERDKTGAEDDASFGVRKRENTRARLIRAGRKLFFTRPYPSISVDQIAREAGFTRAAFYLHFANKDEVVAVVMLDEAYKSEPIFQWFETRPRDRASAIAFVRAFFAKSSELWAGKLFHIAALQSDMALNAYCANRERLMTVMGRGFPAFRPAADRSAPEMARIANATMTIVALEQMTIRERDLWDEPLGEAMVEWMADSLVALDRRFPE